MRTTVNHRKLPQADRFLSEQGICAATYAFARQAEISREICRGVANCCKRQFAAFVQKRKFAAQPASQPAVQCPA